jgi:surfactin synthase thioesterase subunit
LVGLGQRVLSLIPRDLRNAVVEVSGQADQLAQMRHALTRLKVPVHVVHGDADDFAPIELAQALVSETRTRAPLRFATVAGNHFLNDGPVQTLIDALEACIPAKKPAFTWRWPKLPKLAKAPALATA